MADSRLEEFVGVGGCLIATLKLIARIVLLAVTLTTLVVVSLCSWVWYCWEMDTYPSPSIYSNEAFVSRDRCFIKTQRSDLVNWCQQQTPVHQPIEIVLINEW